MTSTFVSRLGGPGAWRQVWIAPGMLLVGLMAASGCDDSDTPVAPGALRDCAQVALALDLELQSIQACGQASECGQELIGTSCGCTRNLVARLGANTDGFYAIVRAGRSMACPATEFATTCDCPAADGFACVDRRCTWNYR